MSEEAERAAVSVLGLGYMGSALARALLDHGHSVTVWNRTASKAQPLAEVGAAVASSAADAVAASDVVVACVTDYHTSDAILRTDEAAAQLRGKTLIQLTTGTPQDARDGSAWADQHGVIYLDGAIMESPHGVGTPDGTFLYSGSREVFERNEPLLRCLGGNALYLGVAPGHASAMECSLLSFLYSSWIGFLHGAALGESEGISVESFLESALPILSSLMTPLVQSSAEMAGTRSYGSTVARLDANAAALEHIVRFCDESGVDPTLPKGLVASLKRASAAGHGEEDLAAVFEVLRARDGA